MFEDTDIYKLSTSSALSLFAQSAFVIVDSIDVETNTHIDSAFKGITIKPTNSLAFAEIKIQDGNTINAE